jgi:hypothetical protein
LRIKQYPAVTGVWMCATKCEILEYRLTSLLVYKWVWAQHNCRMSGELDDTRRLSGKCPDCDCSGNLEKKTGNHPSICSRTQEKPRKPCVEMTGRRTFRLLTWLPKTLQWSPTLYSPDLVPCVFFLFPKMKLRLKGRRFDTTEEIHAESQEVIDTLTLGNFHGCRTSGETCWDRLYMPKGTTSKEAVETRSYGKKLFLWSNSPTFCVAPPTVTSTRENSLTWKRKNKESHFHGKHSDLIFTVLCSRHWFRKHSSWNSSHRGHSQHKRKQITT